ncbi:hypothetical protein PBI_GRAYSON_143 [Rhodococcus phage Grayson]|nr:hypothetical protein PBI_GRAYSON_143 [Rhodococcus phage Grayson]
MLDLVEIFKKMDEDDRAREGRRRGVHYEDFIAEVQRHAEYEIVDEESSGTDTWYHYIREISFCDGNHYRVFLECENEGSRVLVEAVQKVVPKEYTAIRWDTV